MTIRLIFLVLAVGMTSTPAAGESRHDESKRVREWIAEGRILPLERLLEMNRERLRGRLLDVELERDDGRYVYEIETIDKHGIVREIEIDATTGEWIDEEVDD